MNKLSREDKGVEPPEIAPCLGHGEQDERWMRHAMALAARAEGGGKRVRSRSARRQGSRLEGNIKR